MHKSPLKLDRPYGKHVLQSLHRFSELCWGKVMVAYIKSQQRKKEESKRLRGERDKIKFIYLRFEIWQVVRFRKARRRQDVL